MYEFFLKLLDIHLLDHEIHISFLDDFFANELLAKEVNQYYHFIRPNGECENPDYLELFFPNYCLV